ncbi:RHO alpha subunit C-terminal catalytic domain-containing protein, partial [bacterium]|nr:RHO alpha subunit C-terminal catalytic domain-containing protein [bacterium]
MNRLRLRKWRVECCGKLVFVCKSAEAGTLREFLGGSYDTIEAMANACGTLVDDNRLSIKANWKITVENTLESYHVSFIHPKTFAALGVSEGEFGWQDSHSSWETALSPSVTSRMNRFMALVDDRPAKFPGYFHQLVFPNITLATTCGTTFSIQ